MSEWILHRQFAVYLRRRRCRQWQWGDDDDDNEVSLEGNISTVMLLLCVGVCVSWLVLNRLMCRLKP